VNRKNNPAWPMAASAMPRWQTGPGCGIRVIRETGRDRRRAGFSALGGCGGTNAPG